MSFPILPLNNQPNTPSKLDLTLGDVGSSLQSIGEMIGGYKKQKQIDALGNQLEKETGRTGIKELLHILPPDKLPDLYKQLSLIQQGKDVEERMIQEGYEPSVAKLYAASTTGGQTAITKDLLEMKKRGLLDKGPSSEMQLPGEESIQSAIQEDVGLTPAERVRRESERFKTGAPKFEEARTKSKSYEDNERRFKILDQLNKTKKLPKGFGYINLDKMGNLKVPFLASPEAQRYVKTMNEFSSGAKDTYGSRVTNFDLAQYLKQFPTLMNSEKGREQIIQQMKIVNDINKAYYNNLKDVFKRAGGSRKIDYDLAESIADEMTRPQVEEYLKKFDEIGMQSTLPEAFGTSNNGMTEMISPSGKKVMIPNDQVQSALQSGGRLSQ